MSFNQSDAPLIVRRAGTVFVAGSLALVLSACQTVPEPVASEPMAVPPPPPPPVGASMPAPPPTFRVRSGSPSVLAKFPRGSVVAKDSKICLKEGEQITISGSNGQSVSYRGPGCAQRNARPTGTNQGGFTFGWNDFAAPLETREAP